MSTNSPYARQKIENAQSGTALYRLTRALCRLRFAVRRTRLLWADRIPARGRVLLIVNGPARTSAALLLTAAFERPLHCVLQEPKRTGFAEGLLAAGCGVTFFKRAKGNESSLVSDCERCLLDHKMAVFLAESGPVKDGHPGPGLETAARLSVELARLSPDSPGLAVHLVDLFNAGNGSRAGEDLIYVGGAAYPAEYLHRAAGDAAEAGRSFASALEEIRRSNPLRLNSPELVFLLQDLEGILRADLDEDWKKRPGWRQSAAELELSGLVSAWANQTNVADAAGIVPLRGRVEKFRAARQRWAARQFAAETAGDWIASSFRRALVWLEGVLGFPVAFYGVVNHLIVGAIYAFLRRLEGEAGPGAANRWFAAGIGALGGYTLQILFCDHWLGRAAAGYYALTLPVSGAYLWRYSWLLRNRGRAVLTRLLAPVAKRQINLARQAVVNELDRRIAAFAAAVGAPH